MYKFITIKSFASYEFKEKGSKFIGLIIPCSTEEEIKNILSKWRNEFSQATHVAYAYRLGVDGSVYRANDDGEVSNTAGAPILGQMVANHITNAMIAVVRFYGGTKLGVGGLISAYREAAKGVIAEATLIEKHLKKLIQLDFDYSEMPAIMEVIKRNRWEVKATKMEETCQVFLLFEPDVQIDFQEWLGKYKSIVYLDKGLI